MNKIYFNSEYNYYPLIIIPGKIIEDQNKKINNKEIVEFLNLKYPELDLKIYYKSHLPEKYFKQDINHYNRICKDYQNSHTEKIYSQEGGYTIWKTVSFYLKDEKKYLNSNEEDNHVLHYVGNYELPLRPNKFESVETPHMGCLFFLVAFLATTIFIAIAFEVSFALFFFAAVSFFSLFIVQDIGLDNTRKIKVDENKFKTAFEIFLLGVQSTKEKVELNFNNTKTKLDLIAFEKRNEVENLILSKNLKPYYNIKKISNVNNRGKTEMFFFSKLYEHFNNQINIDVVPDIGKNPFQPDFVLICKETNFHIDIEIDEPYSVDNGKPIHHDRTNDDERDLFFEEINWGIIRFTERQIVENSEECISLIQNVLNAINNKQIYFEHKVPLEKKWSYEEALIMSSNGFRNTYLPNNMKVNIQYKKANDYFDNDDLPF